MARGHQKFQSQQKNAQKQEKLKKAQGHDQKSAALKALVFTCTVCKVQKMLTFHPFTPKISFFNPPLCLLYYNTYGDGSENLALDQLIITLLTFFSILITCLLDIEVIM